MERMSNCRVCQDGTRIRLDIMETMATCFPEGATEHSTDRLSRKVTSIDDSTRDRYLIRLDDTIGCYWNRAERVIGYTKNGIHLGVAFKEVDETILFPTVGFRTTNEEVDLSVCIVAVRIRCSLFRLR